MSFIKTIFTIAIALSMSTLTFASPKPNPILPAALEPRAKTCPGTPLTCGPTLFPTSYVTSGTVVLTTTTVITKTYTRPVTLPTTATIPKSCYTYLVPVPQSNNDFCGPWTSTCGPTKPCTVTETVTGPCKDPCCTCTKTTTTLGGCRTCNTGCATKTKFVAQSTGCPPV